MTLNQLTLILLTSVRCAWCSNLVDPASVQEVEVKDDEHSKHATGTALVCCECLESLEEE
jgi:hypothetical protein